MGRVEGEVALVTGGRRGLGELRRCCWPAKARKSRSPDPEEAGAEAVLRAIASAGRQGIFIQQDVCKEEEMKRTIDEVLKRFGRLGILVNNAGVGAGKNIKETTLED